MSVKKTMIKEVKYGGKKVYHLKKFYNLWSLNSYVLIILQFDNKNFLKNDGTIAGNRVILKTSFLNTLLQNSGVCFSGTVSCYFLKDDKSLVKFIQQVKLDTSLNLCMGVVSNRLRILGLDLVKRYSTKNVLLNLMTFRYSLLLLLFQKILLLRSIKGIMSRRGV